MKTKSAHFLPVEVLSEELLEPVPLNGKAMLHFVSSLLRWGVMINFVMKRIEYFGRDALFVLSARKRMGIRECIEQAHMKAHYQTLPFTVGPQKADIRP